MKRILVAEDEAALRDALSEMLISEGYEVLMAVNGQECLDVLRTESVDLLLLDIKMPIKDGIEVLQTLKSSSDLKMPSHILVLSNQDDMESLSAVMEQGVFQYLIKADHSLAAIAIKIKEMVG